MVLIDAQLMASEVLRAFHRDEPLLFLGAGFSTVAFLAICYCALRRRFDPLLVSMAIFAHLYGQRLWLDSHLLRMCVPDTLFMAKLRMAIDFLVPVPGFIFFQIAGFIPSRGKVFTGVICSLFLVLVVATFALGPVPLFHTLNNLLVVIALPLILVRSLRKGSADRDSVVLRSGLICFVGFALWDNIVGSLWFPSKVEPYGFAILLACLGYVAARRMLERDLELGQIHKELDLARGIQLSILPGPFPDSTNFRVATRYVPMTSVAGDLYDYLVTGDCQTGLLIADVSGHGVPAALIASMVKMAALSQRSNAAHPALLMAGMNAALCGNTQGQFVTAAYVYLDAEARQLRYAAAGHPSMLLLRNGCVTEIIENGLLLAASDRATYAEVIVPIEHGDRLLLYTDGLTEARNTKGELFGEEALITAFKNTSGMVPSVAANQIVVDIEQWARWQDDDLTVLVCDFLGAVSE